VSQKCFDSQIRFAPTESCWGSLYSIPIAGYEERGGRERRKGRDVNLTHCSFPNLRALLHSDAHTPGIRLSMSSSFTFVSLYGRFLITNV